MLIIEGGCHICFGNLILSEEGYFVECESCGLQGEAKNSDHLRGLLIHLGITSLGNNISKKNLWLMLKNRAVDWGPKEKRRELTQAGTQLMNSYRTDEVPDSQEVYDTYQAYKGLLSEETRLKELREGGFIL